MLGLQIQNDIEDFMVLVSAKKLYCAPSTFSWWAAHSLRPDSCVILPNILDQRLGIYINKDKYTLIK